MTFYLIIRFWFKIISAKCIIAYGYFAASVDESTDTNDAIDWLVKNVSGNNGKAGMLGISSDGWTTMMGTLDKHPALKAASEQATSSDQTPGKKSSKFLI